MSCPRTQHNLPVQGQSLHATETGEKREPDVPLGLNADLTFTLPFSDQVLNAPYAFYLHSV